MKFLLFAGSLRAGSLNKKLIAVAEKILAENPNNQVTVIDLKTLSMPVYDGDIEAAGIPEGVVRLGNLISEADALVLSSPEYNGSIAGSFKNTIDWVSRLRPVPFEKKPILLMSASPGYFGGIKSLTVDRAPFETLNAYLYPQSFPLTKAAEAFTPSGELVDEGTKKRLTTMISGFTEFAKKFKA